MKTQLHFDPELLAEQKCTDFENWKHALDPMSVTVVFSSYFMGNPSSTFGHTLLRLNHRNQNGREPLLDYGVSYAADPTTNNALLYGILGLTGGFDGVFSNTPYYLKVSEYNDVESRELWEYDLKFTTPQIDNMMLHLWTLGHISTPYYFFDQNCSYMLLTLLDAANPELKLGDEYNRLWVIPADTIRGVAEKPGLVSKVEVRPSLAYRLKRQLAGLSSDDQDLFFDYIQHPGSEESKRAFEKIQKLPLSISKNIYDLSLDYFRYLTPKYKGKLPLEVEKLQSQTLEARAGIAAESSDIVFSEEEIAKNRPDIGHDTARFTLGGGYQNVNGTFDEIGIRPAFQDLNAQTLGYPRGMEIDLLDIDARFSPQTKRLKLERLNVAQVISLEPYERMFKKSSWSVRLGADPIRDFNCGDCVEYKLNGGTGFSFSITKPVLIYGLLKGELGFGPNTSPGYRIGPAGEIGALITISDQVSFNSLATYHYPVLGYLNAYSEASAETRVSLLRDLDLRIGYYIYRNAKQGKILFNVYF